MVLNTRPVRDINHVATFILPIENQKTMLKDTNRVGGIGRLEIATSVIETPV